MRRAKANNKNKEREKLNQIELIYYYCYCCIEIYIFRVYKFSQKIFKYLTIKSKLNTVYYFFFLFLINKWADLI